MPVSIQNKPLIWILDDDQEVVDSLNWLLQTIGLQAQALANPEELERLHNTQQLGCLLLDVRLPQISGLEILQQLKQQNFAVPVIMMSGHADVSMAVRAMKLGAVDFFEKPFNDQQLLESLQAAIAQHRQLLQKQSQLQHLQQLLRELTERERQIMQLLMSGQAVKKIAVSLNISPKTVDVHRFNLMHKLQVNSLAELIHLGYQLGLISAKENP